MAIRYYKPHQVPRECRPCLGADATPDGRYPVDTASDCWREGMAAFEARVAARNAPPKAPARYPGPAPMKPAATSTPRQGRQSTAATTPVTVDDVWKARGPRMWAELHAWAQSVDLSTPGAVAKARGWLDAFTRRIGCGTCLQHWAALVKAFPPDFADNARLYQWSVLSHDRVNARLRKPLWWGLVKV